MSKSDHEGIFTTNYCPRERVDCKSFSQLIAQDHASFICCGENNGEGREVEQDKYRVCVKSSESVDSMQNCDKRDLMHQASVIMGALAVIEENDCAAYHQARLPKENKNGSFDQQTNLNCIADEKCQINLPTKN